MYIDPTVPRSARPSMKESTTRQLCPIHGHLHPLLGMLEYAMAADDREMIQFVRKSYKFTIDYIDRQVGYVPETLDPSTCSTKNRPFSETCGVADMIHMALKLTLAGAGDYWDDMDRWTRNQFAENTVPSTSGINTVRTKCGGRPLSGLWPRPYRLVT